MEYSIVQYSALAGALRLDAEYYRPSFLEQSRTLQALSTKPLVELCEKIDVGFVSSMTAHFVDDGIPLLRTQNVGEFLVNTESGLVKIDETFHQKLKKSQVSPGQVLVARSGSIGAAAVVPTGFLAANSADIIILQPKPELLPEYLAAFLNSRYGKFQILRGSSGGIQGHINLFSLEQLTVPVLEPAEQQRIQEIVLRGIREVENSRDLYKKAEQLLLDTLGVQNLEVEEDGPAIATVMMSQIREAERLDAEYFQPKYEQLAKLLRSFGSVPFGECIITISPRFDPQNEPDKQFSYVELANIDASIGIVHGTTQIIGRDAPSRARRTLATGDVIVSSVEGSLEKAALVHESETGFIASTGFFQLRSSQIFPEVMLVLVRSIIFRAQLQQRTTGTILSAIPSKSLQSILVPVLESQSQREIASLVRQSHEARQQAQVCFDEAKRLVETTIEQQARKTND